MVILDILASHKTKFGTSFPCNSTHLLILETRSADLNMCLPTIYEVVYISHFFFFFLVTRYSCGYNKVDFYVKMTSHSSSTSTLKFEEEVLFEKETLYYYLPILFFQSFRHFVFSLFLSIFLGTLCFRGAAARQSTNVPCFLHSNKILIDLFILNI